MRAEQLQILHEAAMTVLQSTGIVFQDHETVRLLASHGFPADGRRVFIPPDAVAAALSTAPGAFALEARAPGRDLMVGKGDLVSTNACGAARRRGGGGTATHERT